MTIIRTLACTVAAAAALTGCQQGLDDNRYPTGSTPILSSASYDAVVTANTDDGTVSRVDVESGDVLVSDVLGDRPTRLARVGDEYLVTMRGDREVAVLDADLEVVDRIATGTEPVGVVAAEDGSRFWVAASTQGVVQEFDATTRELLRTFSVDGEPRWLALHPDDHSVYAGSVFGGLISHIDLDTGAVTAHQPPAVTGFDPNDSSVVTLTPRVTGDPAVHPNGRYLAVPVLHVDNISKGPDLSTGVTIPGQGYYVQDNGSRFRPGIAAIPLDGNGDLVTEEGETVDLTVFDADFNQAGSYPSAVVFADNGNVMVVPLEASDAVVAIDAEEIGGVTISTGGFGSSSPSAAVGGLTQRTNVVVKGGDGTRGAAVLDEDAVWLQDYLGDRVSTLSLPTVRTKLGSAAAGAGSSFGTGTLSIIDYDQAYMADGPVVGTGEALTDTEQLGRELFFSATDSTMVIAGAGVSCSTCHFEGRNDGLTWPFSDPFGPRQTPSLAGVFGETRPVTWDSGVPTVAEEAFTTSNGRMGGYGPDSAEAAAIEAFVNSVGLPDAPLVGSDDAAIARGAEIFEREDVGCAECHTPDAQYTDGEIHAMYDLDSVRTRSLEGLATTAPYLHDGSSATIAALIERLEDGSMGDTSMLSDAEKADLEAFLLSL